MTAEGTGTGTVDNTLDESKATDKEEVKQSDG